MGPLRKSAIRTWTHSTIIGLISNKSLLVHLPPATSFGRTPRHLFESSAAVNNDESVRSDFSRATGIAIKCHSRPRVQSRKSVECFFGETGLARSRCPILEDVSCIGCAAAFKNCHDADRKQVILGRPH
jgi:hypothetical protein